MSKSNQSANPPPSAIHFGSQTSSLYAAAGVDIDAGNRAVDLMKSGRALYIHPRRPRRRR